MEAIRLRHPYGPDEGRGQIYLASSLPAALAGMGVDLKSYEDLNVSNYREFEPSSGQIAIHATGMPDLPALHSLVKKWASKVEVVIGGIVLENMEESLVRDLFPGASISGHDFPVPDATQASLVPFYELISDKDMRLYLENEFSLYLSNGCVYSCSHCAALRTQIDPFTGEKSVVKETYRSHSQTEVDLRYLIERASRLGLNEIQFYLSNLDSFQTPFQIKTFIRTLKRLKAEYPNFKLKIRGLTNVNTFLKFSDQDLSDFVSNGLDSLGFGVDAGNERMQRAIRKMHTGGLAQTIKAVERSNQFGIRPELLTIYGHPDDDAESMRAMFDFMSHMVLTHSVVPRPHVYRVIPGNDMWVQSPHFAEAVRRDPWVAQAFDFTAEATDFTHPGSSDLVNRAFRDTCELDPERSTRLLRAIRPDMSAEERKVVSEFNSGKYDR